MRSQPDGRLAALAAAGSEPAFEAIVHRYRRPLLGYCRRLRMGDNRSEDVVQQTFMKAWGSLREGTEVRELRPWLYRITHNQAISMMRSIAGDETELDEAESIVGIGGVGADDVYERQARLRDTLRAISDLPALQREALLATAIDGLSYEDTAAALGVGADAVRGLVYRARNTVRAGMAVVSPAPLIAWAASQGAPVVLSEAAAGGGAGLTLSAAAVKSALVLASSAAVVGGTVSTGLARHLIDPVSSPVHRHGARAVGPGLVTALAPPRGTARARTFVSTRPLDARRGGAVLSVGVGALGVVRSAQRSGVTASPRSAVPVSLQVDSLTAGRRGSLRPTGGWSAPAQQSRRSASQPSGTPDQTPMTSTVTTPTATTTTTASVTSPTTTTSTTSGAPASTITSGGSATSGAPATTTTSGAPASTITSSPAATTTTVAAIPATS